MAGTQRMQVANEAFLLDRLAADAPRAQLYRELTQNAIEAVRRRIASGDERPGIVQWDIDWLGVAEGQQKLCVIDNGDGMSASDMQRYLNSLAVQGANEAQGIRGNFGLGAKITALFHNAEGLLYLSWLDGKGNNVWLHRDADAGVYGLKLLEDAAGEVAYVRPMSDAAKPMAIGASGTKVILLGGSAEAQTWRKPEGLGGGDTNWLYKYLNTRYFRLPDFVSVKVRNLRKDPANWPVEEPPAGDGTLNFITVRGMKTILDGQVTAGNPGPVRAGGTTSIPGASVHWWLFEDRDAVDVAINPKAAAPGHVGLVYQDEIYTLKTGAGARKLMAMFGILYGSDRLVLYVEPDPGAESLHADTARSRLIVDGADADSDDLWARWGVHFRERLPPEIRAFTDRLLTRDDDEGRVARRERIVGRLHRLEQLLGAGRYRPKSDGEHLADGRLPPPARAGPPQPRAGDDQPSPKGGKPGERRDYLARLATSAGVPSIPTGGAKSPPATVWISMARGLRAKGELEGRAGDLPGEALKADVIRLNEDFEGFKSLFELFVAEVGASADPALAERVVDVVKEWLETQALEVVMGMRALAGSGVWSPQDLQTALSPEALTAAMMGRYLLAERVRRSLSAQFGSEAHRQVA